jgi:hypothetical protein
MISLRYWKSAGSIFWRAWQKALAEGTPKTLQMAEKSLFKAFCKESL